MELVDMNVPVYAYRTDSPDHEQYQAWFQKWLNSDTAVGLSELALSGFLQVVTQPKVFNKPTPIATALTFVEAIRAELTYISITPGPRHWEIFARLCQQVSVKGNLVPDAYFAAMAIESGREWIATDRDYSRFPGLRWRHPFQ